MISGENSFGDGGDEAVTSHSGGFGCGRRFLHPKDRRRCTKSAAASSGASCPAGPLAWGISPVSMNGNMALLQHGLFLPSLLGEVGVLIVCFSSGKWMTTTQQTGFAFFANSDQIILSR
ncbi:uncharacterized protein LOC117921724 isoform X1 [Vitis riparia]|uniref:uncharacterized protein LOC117921724 isoform X1 n=1 Tax=Vitis riparia TaxID=96939 RepID=UPI00155A95B3|nr:uncharacterized protein LOC117921724 isoform X1 [Vitis riparia]